jgi:purine nucleoside phosphorylase
MTNLLIFSFFLSFFFFLKAMGMEIFAIALITNLATGLTDETLTHGAVTDVANKAG